MHPQKVILVTLHFSHLHLESDVFLFSASLWFKKLSSASTFFLLSKAGTFNFLFRILIFFNSFLK